MAVAVDVLCRFGGGLEAVGVVIVEESEQVHGVGIDAVLREIVVEACKSVVPIVGLLVDNTVEEIHEREVHDRAQAAVARGSQTAVLLPKAHPHIVVDPGFSHDVEPRIFQFDAFVPSGHGFEVGVGIGVLSDAVDAGLLNPPNGGLDEIIHHGRVLLVEVGHGFNEPAILCQGFVGLGSMGIGDTAYLVVGLHVAAVEVEPVVGRAVGIEEVVAAAVVEHEVHDHLDTVAVAVVDEGIKLFVAAKAGVDLIIVGDGIAVVSVALLIVHLHGGRPEGSDS